MHTDKSGTDTWTPDAFRTAYLSVHAEHAILAAAHALVRSNSGFSATAQAWGRVPLALLLDTHTDACIDVSGDAGRASAEAGDWGMPRV